MSASTKPGQTYTAVIHPEPEGGYWAEVPALPGCFTQGETLDEVYQNVREAVASHVGLASSSVRVGVLEMAV